MPETLKMRGKWSLPEAVRRAAARLSPDSLLSRLILIFSGGFFAILVLTTIYAGESRHFYFMRGLMADRARSMAETAVLLDACSPEIRFVLREQLNTKGFKVYFSTLPPVISGDVEDTREASELMETMLNRSLSRLYDGPRRPHEHGAKREIPRRAALMVNELNLPSPMEAFYESVRGYVAPPPRKNHSSVYRATAVVPLHDGTWLIIEDSSPGYPPMPAFPLTGIIAIELFFVGISLIAFFLCVQPLRRLARAADSFGRDIPGTPPVDERGPTEVREAAQAFNRMQRSIREFLEERERTLAAVSHDLRTPLTRMRLRVEQLDESQRIPLQKDIGELQQLMDTTIDLARSNTEPEAQVDVASLLETLVEDRQDMGLDISLEERLQNRDELCSIAPLKARPQSLKRCLANLMDNGLRYGGHVVVDVKDAPDLLTVTIADSGPGIPEADLEKVFEPFFRIEPSRNRSTGGTGLGLSIARNMARLHGGNVKLSNRPEGGLLAVATFRRS
ncbi:ATP-binding protein [uncultured Mailhella sp.]|uniref:ATP-binding protein n=1 Tax=uncultured Mailhella sp. TaxID=1981031 RepID=UPI002607B219|nr:ATP-binding protein [uncultured Mailhella sp.]